MIKILSVFLGLITGLQPVSVRVGGEVAVVEIQIDGRSVGMLRGEPWEMICNFGTDLAPHELVVIGRNEDGREIARDRQWINLPRARSEVVLTLEENANGPPVRASTLWHSIDRSEPDRFTVTFDGEELAVSDPRTFALPLYDPGAAHLLAVELLFGTTLARTQILVGGSYGEEVSGELTSVPVILEPKKHLPGIEEMRGWFLEDGLPLSPVALERGGADIMMVMDPSSDLRDGLDKVRRQMARMRYSRTPGGMSDGMMVPMGVRPKDRVNIFFPLGEPATDSTQPVLLFPRTPDVSGTPGGMTRIVLTPFQPNRPIEATRLRIADSVAVAGLVAAENERARAVVLIQDPASVDESWLDETTVRDYLRRINVPLKVWIAERKAVDGPWAPYQRISSASRLVEQVEALANLVERQTVVWIAGRHLPDRITLSPEAREIIRLAGEPGAGEAEAQPKSRPPVADVAEDSRVVDPAPREAAVFGGSVEVQTVNVHVVVSDNKGNRVTDLTRDDFEVFEDGEPMEISHFVPPPDPPEAIGESASEEAESPEAVTTAPRQSDEQPFYIVILFDTAHVRPSQRELMVGSLREFLVDGLPPSARVMLVAQEGPIRVRQTFTGSPQHVLQGFDELMGAGHSPGDEERRRMHAEITKVGAELQAAYLDGDPGMIDTAEVKRSSLLLEIRSEAEAQRFEMRANYDVLSRFVSSLGGVPGRKVLLYVGGGLILSPGDDLYAGAVRAEVADDQMKIETGFGLHREADKLARKASANGVTFYTLTPPSSYALMGAAMSAPGPLGYNLATEMRQNTNIREGACLFSQETGGRCQSGGTEPGQLLDEASLDFVSTYTIAYSPDRPSDGDYHRIEIKVEPKGLRLRHRVGYLDKKHGESLGDRLSAALRFDAEDNPLDMALEINAPGTLDDGKYMVPMKLRVPVDRLALLPNTAGDARSCQTTLLVTTMDEDGYVVGPQEYPVTIRIDEANFESGRTIIYAHEVHITLAKGNHRVAIGLWDNLGRMGSFLAEDLQVP